MQLRPEQNVTFKMYFSFTSQRGIYSFSVFTYILTTGRQFSGNIVYTIYYQNGIQLPYTNTVHYR